MAPSNPKSTHNQPLADPIAHFKSIPLCATLLCSKSIVQTTVPDRTPLSSTESALVRETLNTSATVKACITFLRYIKPTTPSSETGEDPKNPFLEFVTLLDLGSGVNGFAKTAHGGFYGVVLDEVMGSAAQMQAKHGAYIVTLTVDFKKPLFTPSVVVCRGRVVKKEGKKLHLRGSFQDKDGSVLAESRGIWVMMQKDIGRWTDKKKDSKL